MTEPDPRDQAAEDAAWRDIVANYGERPDFPEPEEPPARPAEYVARLDPAAPEEWSEADDTDTDEATDDPDLHYTPPPAPPVPRPHGPRLAAWLGVCGAPLLLLVLILLGVAITGWIGFLLFVAFLSGFGYLVATMRKDDDDPWDDGAVV